VAHYWREREHRRVWEDPSHWRYMHRHGLVEKVKPVGEKSGRVVGWTADAEKSEVRSPKSEVRAVKFRKTYG
jgi:hypothetical protein